MSLKDDDNLLAPPSSTPDPSALSGCMGPPASPSFAGPQRITPARHTSNAPYNLPTRLPHQRSSPPVTSHSENPDLPYTAPRLVLSGDSLGTSLLATPYQDLRDSQLKKLKSIKLVDRQVALIKQTLEQLGGPHYNHETIVAALARGLDLQSRRRPFSLLTKNDFKVLNPALRGVILVNEDAIAKEILSIPDRFYEELHRCRSTFDRSMEQGCRTVVARYFEWALHLARVKFEMPRLVVFQEEEVVATDVPGVGEVHGPLDFITGIAAGEAPMGKGRSMSMLTYL
jgi:hypothetical protein